MNIRIVISNQNLRQCIPRSYLVNIFHIMNAIILSAGKGTRLKDLTSKLPKPMIKIEGKPILQHNIELCKNAGIY